MAQKISKNRLVKYWSIKNADMVYGLEIRDDNGKLMRRLLGEFDVNWAQRTAEHYGIDMPTEVEAETEAV